MMDGCAVVIKDNNDKIVFHKILIIISLFLQDKVSESKNY